MTHDKRQDQKTQASGWEARINELLDGELDAEATAALKQEAAEDAELARAIIEAYELQRGMEQLGIEPAPASLRKKLRQVPRAESPLLRPRRWVMAATAAGVSVLAVSLILKTPEQPTPADIEKARQDLALAFSYIDRVGYRTSDYMQDVLGTELSRGVTDNLSRYFPYTEQSQEEENS